MKPAALQIQIIVKTLTFSQWLEKTLKPTALLTQATRPRNKELKRCPLGRALLSNLLVKPLKTATSPTQTLRNLLRKRLGQVKHVLSPLRMQSPQNKHARESEANPLPITSTSLKPTISLLRMLLHHPHQKLSKKQ